MWTDVHHRVLYPLLHPHLHMARGGVRYMIYSYISSFTLCCRSLIDIDARSSLFLIVMIPCWFDVESSIRCTCCHNSSCYVLKSRVVCCWDILVVIMHVFCFDIPFASSWRDAHHTCFLYHTNSSILIESSSCGTSLRATPAWGHSSLYDRDIISMYITLLIALNALASSVAFNWSCNHSFSSVYFCRVSYTISTFLEMLTMVSYINLSSSVIAHSIVHTAIHINAKTYSDTTWSRSRCEEGPFQDLLLSWCVKLNF